MLSPDLNLGKNKAYPLRIIISANDHGKQEDIEGAFVA